MRLASRLALPAALICASGASGTAWAKPLYLTVPRTYAPSEDAVVEVAFAGREPVELRVLQPESLDAFVAAQQDLRRAYDPPVIQTNPGRYLARGLNALGQPGRFLLDAIDPELRRGLSPELPPRAEEDPLGSGRPISRLNEGAPKLIGVPPGMKLVRSEWLNLDLGGAQRDFNVPGFDAWSGASGFEERRISLGRLPAGVYVAQLVQGRVEGQVLLVISDLTVQVKQTDGLLLARVAGRDQLPRAGAKVQVYLRNGKGPSGETDEHGELRVELDEPRCLVAVKSGSDVAIVDTDFYSSLAVVPDVFVYTDRPIYKPGDEASFRGVVRKPDGFLARLFAPERHTVKVRLVAQDGREVSTRAYSDAFGSFSGKLRVPFDLDTGVLRVFAEVDDQSHQAEARVQDYVKPTFYLEIESEQDSVKPGETIRAKVRARRYSGGAPEDTRYDVFLYRTVLDTPAWVDDAGMGGKGSAVTYGSASTNEGMLSVPKRLYSSVEARLQSMQGDEMIADDGDPWSSAPLFDAKGEAEIAVPVPALEPGEERFPFKYTLTVRARDDQETFATASRAFYFAESEVMGTLATSKKVVIEGAEATLSVRATSLAGRPYGETTGSVALVLRKADGSEEPLETRPIATNADGVWRGPLPTSRGGTVVARVTLNDRQSRPWSGETTLLVAGRGGEAIARVPALALDAVAGVLGTDGTAQLIAMFPSSWGPGGKNAGPVWLTLSGSTLFETRQVEVEGSTLIHSFEIEPRFGSAVYASVAYPTRTGRWEERTVPFRIVPAARALDVTIEALSPEAPPLGEQTLLLRVTDSRGRGVPAQLSIGVVDKAVYAVQRELRPRILDFFYPLGRNNVMSFYSAEFQGYGHGEEIARRRGWDPYEFAAIKPPEKKTEDRDQDTAYWNPAVTTDGSGNARVTFELPANQTLWVITAVVADASGRFGEKTAEFATRGAMSLYAAVPQFLRAGDEAVASVRLSHGQETKGALSLDVSLAAHGAAEGSSAEKVTLENESVVRISLRAKEEGASQLAIRVTGGPAPLSSRREVTVEPAAVEEVLSASVWGGGELALDVPAGARVEDVELELAPSIVEAALASVRDLLDYPYGCLEQLVATTVPNIAVAQTLEKIGGLDADSRALLAEARSRAVQGVDRILALHVAGGGFTWFSGYSTPSVELTLIALDGLTYAIEAGLVKKNDPRIVASAAWVEKQEGLPPAIDAVRTYVLARVDGPRHAARVRALIASAGDVGPHAVALAVLAAEQAGIAGEAGTKERIAALVEESRSNLGSVADWRPDEAVYWHYPLRRIGLWAVVAHAASKAELDLVPVRRRLTEALSDPMLPTFERSTALLHSLWLIERDAKAMRVAEPPSLAAGGEPLQAKLRQRGSGRIARLGADVHAVSVGAFEGVATLRARALVPLASVQARAEGMKIERTYWVLRESGKVKLAPGDAVAQGEEVFVELAIDAHGGDEARATRSAYYVVEDAVPAGFEPLIEDKEYRGPPHNLPIAHEAMKRRSLSPDHAVFFFEEPAPWSDSPRVVGYVLRARFPGTYSAPPADVEDMYAPAIRARTAAASLRIASPEGAR